VFQAVVTKLNNGDSFKHGFLYEPNAKMSSATLSYYYWL